ncbi:MAG: hypothetical protein ACXWEY_07660, partial [Bacteroidia bacterium]
MIFKAFFRLGIYGFLMASFFACSAQKRTASAVNKSLANANQVTETMQEDSSGEYKNYLAKAEKLKARGDTLAALENYDLAIKLLPNKADAYELKGYLLVDFKVFTEAVK